MNRAIKRRTDVFGIFPNDAAITHLAGAVLLAERIGWERGLTILKPRGP